MKRLTKIILVLLTIGLIASPSYAAKRVYIKTALTGNTSTSLDGIEDNVDDSVVVNPVDGDMAFVNVTPDTQYIYVLDADSGLTENSPYVIDLDNDTGDKRWILQKQDPGKYYVNPGATDQGVDGGDFSLKALIDAIGSDNAIIVLKNWSTTTTYTVTTAEVVPSNIYLEIEPGALIAGTLTINSPAHIIATDRQQIFAAGATITFTEPGKVVPGWWYSGSGYWTTAIQAAVDSITGNANYSGKVYFPTLAVGSQYEIDDEITVTSKKRLIFEGDGHGSYIEQVTNAKSGFVLTGCNEIEFNSLLIRGDGTATTADGVRLDGCSKVVFWNIRFAFWEGSGIGEVNNDSIYVTVDSCEFANIGEYGIEAGTNSGQANVWRVLTCRFDETDYTSTNTAVYWTGSGGTFIGNSVEGYQYGFRLPGHATAYTQAWEILTNYFENVVYPVYLAETQLIRGGKVTGNYFKQDGSERTTHTAIYDPTNGVRQSFIGYNHHQGSASNKNASFADARNCFIEHDNMDNITISSGNLTTNIIHNGGNITPYAYIKTMAGNETISASKGNTWELDPNGASRNCDPDTDFQRGAFLFVRNTGATGEILSFDSGGINENIEAGFSAGFYYSGSNWRTLFKWSDRNTAASSGTGTVKMGSVNSSNSDGFIELLPGRFFPYWNDATP